MSTPTTVHCIVDDTALTTNISELETWVGQGAITLVIPLHTLERLHLLKKDPSQIGHNSRKAVKFLDRMTSGIEESVILQGPDEQYATWEEVEAHYGEDGEHGKEMEEVKEKAEDKDETDKSTKRSSNSGGALSQMLLDKLNFQPAANSPGSTPPLSPASSEPQSSKTSPEVKAATMVAAEKSPVPQTLKPLLNPVVWYIHEKQAHQKNTYFLTNSADTQHLARDFKVPTKTIHQLRSAIGMEAPVEQPLHRKQRSMSPVLGNEPQTLFSYDDESEEEEVVFKPRGRGTRATGSGRGGPHGSIRSRAPRSPRLSFTTPSQPVNKPQIPIDEIDPDSFDRGSFGRGGTLANTAHVGNHAANYFNGTPRGPSRGGFTQVGSSRGMNHYRGGPRGIDRGSARGRGRLFIP